MSFTVVSLLRSWESLSSLSFKDNNSRSLWHSNDALLAAESNDDDEEEKFRQSRIPQYYKWGNDNDDDDDDDNHPAGIDVAPLLAFAHDLLQGKNEPRGSFQFKFNPLPGRIVMLNNGVATLQVSEVVQKRRRAVIVERLRAVGGFLQQTLQEHDHNLQHYPALQRALDHNNSPPSIPLIWDMGDFVGCNHYNYQYAAPSENVTTTRSSATSVPYFTLSGAPTCHYKFPVPSYTTIQLVRRAQDDDNNNNNNKTAPTKKTVKLSGANVADIVHDWTTFFAKLDATRPWHNKTAAAVWRGGLSGPRGGPRFQLVELAKQQQPKNATVLNVAVAGE